MTRALRELDSVVLLRDLPEHGRRAGDLGAIVFSHASEAFEVEFASASGYEQVVVTVDAHDLRPLRDDDQLTVRPGTPDGDRA